jgi:Excalibur calcium-binding domain
MLRTSHRRSGSLTAKSLLAGMIAIAGVLGIDVSVGPTALADPPYANCKAAAKDGRYNIPRGDPAYAPKLDRDNDGIACER